MPGGEELSSWLACLMIFGCFGDDDMALLKFAINSSGDDGETPCLEVFPCWLDLFRLLAILAMGAAFLIGLLSTGFCALALSCVICCLFCLFCRCGGSFGAGRFGCMLLLHHPQCLPWMPLFRHKVKARSDVQLGGSCLCRV